MAELIAGVLAGNVERIFDRIRARGTHVQLRCEVGSRADAAMRCSSAFMRAFRGLSSMQ